LIIISLLLKVDPQFGLNPFRISEILSYFLDALLNIQLQTISNLGLFYLIYVFKIKDRQKLDHEL